MNTFPCASLGDVRFHGMQDPKGESCIPWNPTSPREAHDRECVHKE